MSFARPAASLDIAKASKGAGDAPVEYTKALYELRSDQKEMIKKLAKANGTSQVSIMRDIIDQWRDAFVEGKVAQ